LRRTRFVAVLLLILCLPSKLFGQVYRVEVDPRVELLSIVFRLAGINEYSQGDVPSYLEAIDRYFAPYRNHPAIQLARELAQTDGVRFGAPMDLAVHVKDVHSLAERIPFDNPDAGLAEQWHGAKARRFLEALRSFVADTKFEDFLGSQQPLYDLTNERLRRFVEADLDLGWYAQFTGVHAPVRLVVVPGLVNGGPSYGVHFTGSDGITEMYAIPGVFQVDAQGLPLFSGSLDVLETTVHEFAHSYFNPLVDKHYSEMATAGDELYSHVRSAMSRQAYGDGKSLLYESMVRAATIRYVFDHQGTDAARRAIESERNKSFLWIGDLSDLLGTYEKQRDKYPTLESFMPSVARLFNDEASRIAELQRKYEEPKVVSISIDNHSQDVDPTLTQIVIKFDRPMRTAPDKEWFSDPRSSRARFDSTGTVLTVGVSLDPGRRYQFRVSWPGGPELVSAEGVPLQDYRIEFRTREKDVESPR